MNAQPLYLKVKDQTGFPVAEFMVSFGFLVVMVMEQTTLACKEQEVDTLTPIQRLSQQPLPIVDAETRSLRVCGELYRLRQAERESKLNQVNSSAF